MGQIPLALRLPRHASFANYVSGTNSAAVDHVRAVAAGTRRESVWLAGASGAGKSHLLAAACRDASEAGLRAMYLGADAGSEPAVLAELDGVDLLAIDDLHRVAGLPAWEAGLFAVLDARLARGGLLLAADRPPRECGFALPDLASRAAAAAVYRLSLPADEDLLAAVRLQAAERGLEFDDAAATYLLSRVRRNPGELVAWLDRIDRYSLATQRRITIPLLSQIIGNADAD